MGSSNWFRRETINKTEPIGFLFSQTEPNERNRFGSVMIFLFLFFYFFHKKVAVQLVRDVGLQVTK